MHAVPEQTAQTVVMKFGGSSVADPDKIRHVARRLVEARERGDRVVAYLPNIPETAAAFYAVASLGAVWSSCSPDFGARSVVDRFAQIEPKVLFAVDGYRYGGKDFDRRETVAALQEAMPSLERTVVLPYLDPEPDLAQLRDVASWDELLAGGEGAELGFDLSADKELVTRVTSSLSADRSKPSSAPSPPASSSSQLATSRSCARSGSGSR